MRVVIGVDPDAKRHGVAIYVEGKLVQLKMLETYDVLELARAEEDCLIAVEDVMRNQFVYSRNKKPTKAQESKVAMNIGRAQQAQVELCRLLDRFDVPYVKFPPQRGNWAKHPNLLSRFTGWTEKSNEDTRAAAFFGFLALKKGLAH